MPVCCPRFKEKVSETKLWSDPYASYFSGNFDVSVPYTKISGMLVCSMLVCAKLRTMWGNAKECAYQIANYGVISRINAKSC